MNLILSRLVLLSTQMIMTGVLTTLAGNYKDYSKEDRKYFWGLMASSMVTCGAGVYIMYKLVVYYYLNTGGYFA